jgi:uncharacterized protein YjiS (DUF1127 family)
MPQMTQAVPSIARPAAPAGGHWAARLRDAIAGMLARRETRRVVATLSAAQLNDCGIDSAAVLGNRPVVEHHARLTTSLASIR